MELATALIWTLRIALPIVLFWFYFRFQSKEDSKAGPSKFIYGRVLLLNQRRAVLADTGDVPESLANLKLVNEETAPFLFTTGRRGVRGTRESRGTDRDRSGTERRERREERRDMQPDPGSETKGQGQADTSKPPSADVVDAALDEPEVAAAEEKAHLESLLNYVAFNRKDPQRTFLLDEDAAPPPPPPRRPEPVPSADASGGEQKRSSITGDAAERANLEAQMVLRGAINFKRAGVAQDLYDRLHESNVAVTERTFVLLIDACVLSDDLKGSSDFLMKMEAAGFTPDADVLDKVMELYSQKKALRESEKSETDPKAPNPSFLDDLLQGPSTRAKLSSSARLFVPMSEVDLSQAPPPPPTSSNSKSVVTLSKEEVSTAEESGGDELEEVPEQPQRTALKASARPFESASFTAPFAWPEPYHYDEHYDNVYGAEYDPQYDYQHETQPVRSAGAMRGRMGPRGPAKATVESKEKHSAGKKRGKTGSEEKGEVKKSDTAKAKAKDKSGVKMTWVAK